MVHARATLAKSRWLFVRNTMCGYGAHDVGRCMLALVCQPHFSTQQTQCCGASSCAVQHLPTARIAAAAVQLSNVIGAVFPVPACRLHILNSPQQP